MVLSPSTVGLIFRTQSCSTGRFSLSVNERFISNGGYVGLVEWILGRRDLAWLGLLTRRVMQTAQSYQQAQDMLASTPLVAPVYFILAGNASHQGCIITRGRSSFDIWPLGSRHKGQSGDWYLVETNFDHWSQTPFYDHRREYAVQCMDQAGQQKPLQTLYSVLSTRPVLNKDANSCSVFRKAKSEALAANDLDNDPLIDLMKMAMLQAGDQDQYVQFVGNPLHVIIYSKQLLNLSMRRMRLRKKEPTKGEKKRVLYYAVVFRILDNVPPASEFISSSHTAA
ncbi:N-acylsphingosine amidohydrolase activity protein [Homalodisca vitripennis]|nr:N-acylsphingosine amidohydrolase activity protein [Homalodisca vitripennis]